MNVDLDAIVYHEAQLAAAQARKDYVQEAWLQYRLGDLYAAMGGGQKATIYYQQALESYRQLGDRLEEMHVLGSLGSTYYDLNNVSQAITLFEQALRLARDLGSRDDEAITSRTLGSIYAEQGGLDQAIDLLEVWAQYAQETDHPKAATHQEYLTELCQQASGKGLQEMHLSTGTADDTDVFFRSQASSRDEDEAAPTMEIYAPDGWFLKLRIAGYQFPHTVQGGYDANWLIIAVEVNHPGGQWHAQDPCLLIEEVILLENWLIDLAQSETAPSTLRFTEPNLQFALLAMDDGAKLLRVYFEMELRPDWAPWQTVDKGKIWLDFPVTKQTLQEAATSLRQQLDDTPPR